MSQATTTSPERRGFPRLLGGIVVKPYATLKYLSEHAKRAWWPPALLILILTVTPIVAAVTSRQAQQATAAVREQMKEQWEEQGLSAEQQAQREQYTTSPLITVVFPSISRGVGQLVGWLVWAGALYLAGMALGGRGTFGQVFTIVVWAWLPRALRGLLQTIYIFATGQLITNPGLSGLVQESWSVEDLALNPPRVGQMVLRSLLGRIDLFLIWSLVLLVIGVSVTTRLSRRKSVMLTVAVWVLLTVLSLIPTLFSGLFFSQMGATP